MSCAQRLADRAHGWLLVHAGVPPQWDAALALALAEGRAEREALRFASAAAAIKCSRPDGIAGAPTRAEVEALLAAQP